MISMVCCLLFTKSLSLTSAVIDISYFIVPFIISSAHMPLKVQPNVGWKPILRCFRELGSDLNQVGQHHNGFLPTSWLVNLGRDFSFTLRVLFF